MTTTEYNGFTFKAGEHTTYMYNDVFDYDLKKEDVESKYSSVFDSLDNNADGTLDNEELQVLKQVIDDKNTDDNKSSVSKKEAKKIINEILPDSKIKPQKLFGFLNKIKENYTNFTENISDSKIAGSRQGKMGDCWLLSQSRALSQTEWGKEIIKDSITSNEDGTQFNVKLKGVDFETTITSEDIETARKSKKYSKGDVDVLILELGVERYLTQEVENGTISRDEQVLDSGRQAGTLTLNYMLTGNTGHQFYYKYDAPSEESIENKSEKSKSLYKSTEGCVSSTDDRESMKKLITSLAQNIDNYAITCGFKNSKDWDNASLYSEKEKNSTFNNSDSHAYSIKDIVVDDDGNINDIVLINPWSSQKEIHKSLDEFLDQMKSIGVLNESDDYSEFKDGFEDCSVYIDEDIAE